MTVTFHRLAQQEFVRVCQRFRKESLSKRNRFVQAVDQTLERIVSSPESGSPIHDDYRWQRVGRFKYIMIYRLITPSMIHILAIAHGHRRPGYWQGRTKRT